MSRYIVFAFLTLFWVASCLEATPSEVVNKFREDEIVPDVIEDFKSELPLLKISYPSGKEVYLGNILTPTQVKDQPDVEWEAEEGALYTLLMTGKLKDWWLNHGIYINSVDFISSSDPDAPSRKEPTKREFRHWLTVNIQGNDLSSGESIYQFIGSGPPEKTGLHRYVFLLFKQPNGKIAFDSPYVSDHSALGRPSTSTRDLITKYNLKLVAGNFYQAEYDDYVPTVHSQLFGKSV